MHKKHFILDNQTVEVKKFTPRSNRINPREQPQRSRKEHAELLKKQYQDIVSQAIALQDELAASGRPIANGVYMDIEMEKKLMSDALDTKTGAQVLKVSEKKESGSVDVTVFVKKDNKDWLTNKAEDYAKIDGKTGPRNEKLIAPINQITTADIHSLYESRTAFDNLVEETIIQFELWISKREDYSIDSVSQVLSNLSIECNIEHRLQFMDVDVFLIKATKEILKSLPNHLGYIEGVRRYRQPSILIQTHETSREWSKLIRNEINFNFTDDSVRVGILDSGVNNAHNLLARALPNDRMSTAISVQDSIDHSSHGTGMAGLALFGDLTEIAYRRETALNVEHSLASVKIFEESHETDPSFYGAVIEDAINQAQDMGATIDCMAVTDDVSLEGRPTSSSAALDESIYHGGACDRMVVVSAGNIQTSDVDATNYMKSCKANTIFSPSQAWNVLTIGAYTEKTKEDKIQGYISLAAPGGISPMSRSTYSWKNGRIKPEIVMEGGNLIPQSLLGITTNPDLSVITTSQNLNKSLEEFCATSAATGLAARLAAKIKTTNPSLSMLSVRALMVHSAEWTEEMIRIGQTKDIMPLCGYGVPDEEVATFSSEKCATFVFENEIVPFRQGSSSVTYNEMHYYDLPWPVELLEDMHGENVTMRVTLSYYVKPAPGTGGKNNKYRYPSATLHFDVKTSSETEKEFLRRRNKNEGESSTKNDSSRWKIGQTRRENGTVQSDWFSCTAQELAECGKIVVFPGSGWWKERKLENVDNAIKYSLVVSIKSKKTEVYQAVETAISNRIGIQIANNV